MPIKIIRDIDLIEHVREYDAVLIGSGISNSMGNGFQRKININFPYVDKVNKRTPYKDPRKIGTVQVVSPVNGNPYFLICYITKGRMRPDVRPDALEYEGLESCLKLINDNFKGKKIASTILGHSNFEGGGDKEKILSIFEDCCRDIDITLYDYEQGDYESENARRWHEIKDKIGKVTKEEYYDMKKRFLWEENFGIYNEMPDLPEREIKKIIRNYKNNR